MATTHYRIEHDDVSNLTTDTDAADRASRNGARVTAATVGGSE